MLDKRPQFGWLVASVRKIKIEARKLGQEFLQQRNQFPAGDIAYALCETGMMGVHRRVTPGAVHCLSRRGSGRTAQLPAAAR